MAGSDSPPFIVIVKSTPIEWTATFAFSFWMLGEPRKATNRIPANSPHHVRSGIHGFAVQLRDIAINSEVFTSVPQEGSRRKIVITWCRKLATDHNATISQYSNASRLRLIVVTWGSAIGYNTWSLLGPAFDERSSWVIPVPQTYRAFLRCPLFLHTIAFIRSIS